MRSVGARSDPVIGLHGGALLGIVYRTSRRINATGVSTPSSGFGTSPSTFNAFDDGFSFNHPLAENSRQNFQLYSWETFQPIGTPLPQPEWTAWDKTVEYCAFGYQQYIVISSLRPQYRYLGDVAIPHATSAVWHRRQLFVATPTTIEVVFVDAGVSPIDIETKRMKKEQKLKEAQAKAVAEHGELALISIDSPKTDTNERMSLRPPLLRVVRLASFQHAPSVPSNLTLPQLTKIDGDDSGMPEERKVNEVAVGGGGVAVAVTRFPAEQKRPIGPLVVVGVRDGVLWLIDRYVQAHALSLSHPGIRCRCLAAYGDAVSAVKWATRLAREHHDDLAQFMLGMGYAAEALHLPGISKRLEFDLAMQGNDLRRALQCLLTMSNSWGIGEETTGLDLKNLLNVVVKKENMVDAVKGIAKFTKQFFDLVDAADATAQSEIAREALKRLAAAGSVKGALQVDDLRGLALRLANHGELTRLNTLVNNLISLGLGREAAFAAAVLGDNALMEKAWQETGMLAEAVLHSHAHGRPTLRNLVENWNKALQKEIEHTRPKTTDATAAFLASLEDPNLPRLEDTNKKPPIEILPPGMSSLSLSISSAPKKPTAAAKQEPVKPLLLEAPPPDSNPSGVPSAPDSNQPGAPQNTDSAQPGAPSSNPNQPSTSGVPPSSEPRAPPIPSDGSVSSQSAECTQSGAPPSADSNQTQADEKQPLALPSAEANQPQGEAQAPSDENQPLALPSSGFDQSQDHPSPDGKQPPALPPPTDSGQSQGLAPPDSPNLSQDLADVNQPLALPAPADLGQSQGLNQSQQGVPLSGVKQPRDPPLAGFTQTHGIPSAGLNQYQGLPSPSLQKSQGPPFAGLNQSLAQTSPGFKQSQNLPLAGFSQPPAVHGTGFNQSLGIPSPNSRQTQALPSPGSNQPLTQTSAGFNPSQSLPLAGSSRPPAVHGTGFNQSLGIPSPNSHQTQVLPSPGSNQPLIQTSAGFNPSQSLPLADLNTMFSHLQSIPSPSLQQNRGPPSPGLNHHVAQTSAGFDQSRARPSVGLNQPLALTSPGFDQSQARPSAGLNQPLALPMASLNQSQGFPPSGSNQPTTFPPSDLNQTQGLAQADVKYQQPQTHPTTTSNQPTFPLGTSSSGPPLLDEADFLGSNDSNPISTSVSTSTSSPLGGLELLM